MSTALILTLAMALPAQAGRCSETSLARIQSAQALLATVPQTPAIDQAGVVERARILLEKVVDDEPRCKDAWVVKAEADGTVLTVTPISREANLEEAVAEATARVEEMEKANPRDPEDLEVLRFFLADLEKAAPEDQRVKALASRAAVLGGGR